MELALVCEGFIKRGQRAVPLPLPSFSDIWLQWISRNINHMAAVKAAGGMMRRLKLARDLDDLKVSPFPKIKKKEEEGF